MPTYQYRCKECGQPLEAVQSFTDDPLTECPTCGGRLRKVFSAVGVVFKGSGFYRTDSRAATNGGKGKEPAPATSGSSDAGGSTAGDAGSTSSGSTSSGSTSSGSTSSGSADGGSGGAKGTSGSNGRGSAAKPAAASTSG